MVLGEITSPWRGAGPPKSGMDKQGAWKADMEVVIQSHWRCLVEAIQWVDQEKQATPNIREIHENSSDIQMVFSHASKDQRDEASQPQQDSAFHDK